MTSPAKIEHTPTPDSRGWENGARTKIVFHATLAHGDWWQIFNPANEMTLLARETSEARVVVDTLNSHADLHEALKGATTAANIAGSLLKEKDARNADLVKALEVARRYIDAVIVNTPDKKKQRNFGDCLRIIDAALSNSTMGREELGVGS